MKITRKITSNLESRRLTESIDVVQCDGNTRVVEIALLSGVDSWSPPDGVTASVAFEKPDGTTGWYDTLPTGEAACSVSGNVVSATLAPDVLTAAGQVLAAVVFQDASLNQLTTFPFILMVHKNPAAGNVISNSYYNMKTLQEINSVIAAIQEDLAEKILTVTIAGEKASHTSAEIYNHVTKGGSAVLKKGNSLYHLTAAAPESVVFGMTVMTSIDDECASHETHIIDKNGNVTHGIGALVFNGVSYEKQNPLPEQQAQARENIGFDEAVLETLVAFGIAPVYLDENGAVLTDGDDVIFTNN